MHFNNFLLFFKFIIKKKIKKILHFFLLSKKYNTYIENFFLFNKKKFFIYDKIINMHFSFLRNFLDNKKKYLKFFYFKYFFQYMYFYKKFNKRFNRRFKKFFNRFKNLKQEEYFIKTLKKQFLSIFTYGIYRKLKKKNLFSFLMRYKNGNKNLFLRTFYKLNSFLYKFKLKKKKKKLKKKNYRILKKLKTFYYIPNTKKTRKQVFSRFKKSVIYKYKKKKKKK
jgi:hypothetical protein